MQSNGNQLKGGWPREVRPDGRVVMYPPVTGPVYTPGAAVVSEANRNRSATIGGAATLVGVVVILAIVTGCNTYKALPTPVDNKPRLSAAACDKLWSDSQTNQAMWEEWQVVVARDEASREMQAWLDGCS